MKSAFKIIATSVSLVLFSLLWQGCCRSDLHISGKVVDKNGTAIAEASVSVGEQNETTDKEGKFKICVKRAERYMLDVSKRGFGFTAKVYKDTISNLVITLAKATVVTADPATDITVQDVRPDVTPINVRHIANPLDTIPFVYNAQGRLVGFTKPKELTEAQTSISNFQQPVLGARIEIPAGALVMDGTNSLPEGAIEISLSTVDLYSADGMPGDYSVNLGRNPKAGADVQTASEAYMIPYGAANIEAYYNGKRLQLAEGKTATLIIPVDTVKILNRDSIPDQIPLLVYNRTSGHWDIDGSATLNAGRSAYTTQIRHFSTFNMDLFKTTPSCIQMCTELSSTSSLRVTVVDGARTSVQTVLRDPTICADPTKCSVYGLNVANAGGKITTTGIINMPNFRNALVEVLDGSSAVLSTYVLNSGAQPAGTPSTYQACNFDACAGPFYVGESRCWEKKSGTDVIGMNNTVMTFSDVAGTSINFSWIFIEATAAGVITNSTNFYELEYQTYSNTDAFNPLKPWVKVDFDPGAPSTKYFPTAGTTAWKTEGQVLPFDGLANHNSTINFASDIILFRVNVYVGGNAPGSGAGVSTPIAGVVTAHNLSKSTDPNFESDLSSTYSCNIRLQ